MLDVTRVAPRTTVNVICTAHCLNNDNTLKVLLVSKLFFFSLFLLRNGRFQQKSIIFAHTLGKGQHPYPPLGSTQHVELSGHEAFSPGHFTSFTFPFAGVFVNKGRSFLPDLQVPSAISHVYPFGQQWM